MKNTIRFLVVVLIILFSACDPSDPPENVCTENKLLNSKVVPVEQVILDGEIQEVKKSNNAERNGLIGAAGGAALAVASGGLSVPLMALGGAAVGAVSGQGNGTQIYRSGSVSVCRFRVTFEEKTLVYYGDDNEDAGFQHCTMLRVGDQIEVRKELLFAVFPYRGRSYRDLPIYLGKSGTVTFNLN